MDIKRDRDIPRNKFVLPRLKEWANGDQAVSLKTFRACFATQMLSNDVAAPVVMKIGAWKKTATMDIYLRLAGVDKKGASECLGFVPESNM